MPATSRFNEFGDCTVPGQEGRHVTEFENADLTLSELKLKLAALEEERDEEGAVELRQYIQQRELQYNEPSHLENESTSIVQQRLKEAEDANWTRWVQSMVSTVRDHLTIDCDPPKRFTDTYEAYDVIKTNFRANAPSDDMFQKAVKQAIDILKQAKLVR